MKNTHQHVINAIANVVKTRRAALGISQEELAHLAEIDRTYASQIERGIANPSLQVLCNLAKALELSLTELLGESEIL